VWDPLTGDLQLTLGGHSGAISAVSFSPDGSQLATAAVDGRVRIWALDLDTLVDLAEQRVTRTLTDEECQRYLDQETCPTP
jgi:WD40 repeat protein